MGASTDTIFAPASGLARSAVAVVRLSGDRCREVLISLAGEPLPAPRRLSLRALVDPRDGVQVDRALVAWMPGPRSFTGEDCLELHLHGGRAVVAAALAALSALPGLRAAEPGEFTRRAFLNGRLDLTAVEGLADLIDAETEAQRRQALRQLEGALGTRLTELREGLLDALALVEASLDFADEDAVDAERVINEAMAKLRPLRDALDSLLAEGRRGERLRDGFLVVIAGPANAGKSSLLNALARRDAAIVSDRPGTTRDAIEVRLDLGGLPVRLVDTAGLRSTTDPVEQEGVARAHHHLARADLVLWLQAPDSPLESAPDVHATILSVATKSDLGEPSMTADLAVSTRSGGGLVALIDVLESRASDHLGAGDALLTQARHRIGLERARNSLAAIGDSHDLPELVAEEMRAAVQALGEILGHVDADAVLDRVFARFCIGK